MFTALKTIPSPKRGFFKRMLVKIKGTPLRIERVDVLGTYFYLITVERNKKGIDWQTVYHIAGRGASHMLLPQDAVPPDGCGILRFDPSEYMCKVLTNGMISLVESAAKKGAKLSVALLDRNAAYTALLPRLLKSAEEVRIVTAREDAFGAYAEDLLKVMGVSPIISQNPDCIEDCDIALAPGGIAGFGFLPCHPFLFSPDLSEGFHIDGDCINPSELDESLVPDGITKGDFAAALWEYGRIKWLGDIIPQYFIKYGKKISADCLLKTIFTLDTDSLNHYNKNII